MSSLVQDLLSYARLTTEEERPSSIALDEAFEAAITHLDQAIQESDSRITHDPLPTLPVDRGQMVRLFQNLIGNAVKYRKPGQPSEVHVSAEQKSEQSGSSPYVTTASASTPNTRRSLRRSSVYTLPKHIQEPGRVGNLPPDRSGARRPYLGGITARRRSNLLFYTSCREPAAVQTYTAD